MDFKGCMEKLNQDEKKADHRICRKRTGRSEKEKSKGKKSLDWLRDAVADAALKKMTAVIKLEITVIDGGVARATGTVSKKIAG